MHEPDGARQPVAGFAVNQGQAVGGQNFQLAGDVVNVESQVMQALAAALDESSHRALRRQRFQEFQAGLTDFDQARPHALVVHFNHLGVRCPKIGRKEIQRRLNVVDGDSDVINVIDGADFGHQ